MALDPWRTLAGSQLQGMIEREIDPFPIRLAYILLHIAPVVICDPLDRIDWFAIPFPCGFMIDHEFHCRSDNVKRRHHPPQNVPRDKFAPVSIAVRQCVQSDPEPERFRQP